MDSDSDRTIDSDEFEKFMAQSKRGRSSLSLSSKQHLKLHEISDSDSDDGIKKTNLSLSSKQHSKLHEISDSDSDDGIKKRKIEQIKPEKEDNPGVQDARPKCKYGKECYRKNPDHIKNFYHPGEECRSNSLKKASISQSSSNSLEKASASQSSRNSLEKASVSRSSQLDVCHVGNYCFFLTKVNGIPQRYNDSFCLDIIDVLSLKDGNLLASAQFNYMFDIPWLMERYPEKYRACPLTIVHGEQRNAKKVLELSGARYSNIKFCQAKLDIPYGTHHTKMMFLLYKEGFRVVIHTSNIVESDWFQKSQGMWVSPLLPSLKNASIADGESPTNFKSDLLEYVTAYRASELNDWCETIKKHDFSQVRVVLIGSVPGRHVGSRKTLFGHLKLRKVLNLNGPSKKIVDQKWPIIGQFSSIGSLGASPEGWLCGEFSASLATTKSTSILPETSLLKLVYPSVENVRKSLEGYPAGASLPYSIKVAQKQPYLKHFLHQWKSEKLGRSEASPHIKTYLRLSPDNEKIAWFLVTSANLSKAAWGALEKKDSQLMIRSYELGVLFLPKFFESDMFSSPNSKANTGNIFPVPFDIPLKPYSNQDEPWTWDIPHIKGPDRHGNMWCPPV